jgi:hypothetical protein
MRFEHVARCVAVNAAIVSPGVSECREGVDIALAWKGFLSLDEATVACGRAACCKKNNRTRQRPEWINGRSE